MNMRKRRLGCVRFRLHTGEVLRYRPLESAVSLDSSEKSSEGANVLTENASLKQNCPLSTKILPFSVFLA